MLASLRKYLDTNLPKVCSDGKAYTVKFEQYLEAADFPAITFEDFGVPNLGAWAFDDYLGRDSVTNDPVYGKKNQTMVELNCMSDLEQTDDAVMQLYDMADQLEYLFYYASSGQRDENDVRIMPEIKLLDFASGQVDTGARIEAPLNQDAMWLPSYIGRDPVNPNMRRVSIKVRIKWDWRRPTVTSH